MDEMRDRIEIPQVTYQGDDRKLKERIFKFKSGTFRIVIFTIVGLFMGYYSNIYVRDTFFPTKLITAIPYKLTEAVYRLLVPVNTWISAEMKGWDTIGGYFLHSVIADLMAVPLTTTLVGGAVYGSLAYFTGDKRVFTLQRFLKFAGCWCGLLLLVVGMACGIDAKAKADNERFAGDGWFYLHTAEGRGHLVQEDEEAAGMLKAYFYSELALADVERDRSGEVPLGIYYDNGKRYGVYMINYELQYVVTEQEKVYHISSEFAEAATEYMKKMQPGEIGQEVEE